MRELTFGQYYPTNSILHRLDPRVKFAGTVLYIVSLFLVRGKFGYAFCALGLAALILLSKVPFRYIIRSMKPVLMILLVTMLFNLFLTPGNVVFRVWIIRITAEGIAMAVRMGIRLSFLVTGSSLMTLTTTPNALTDGMESLFSFLKVIRVPVHEIAMMMSIALRFIPILTEELDKIRKAQMARGADFETGNFFVRMKAMIPLLVPLFVSAFRRANDLALAMEARCYHGGQGRTRMKPLHYTRADAAAYVIMVLFLGTCIMFGITGL